jgi:hypothetical protein
VQTEHVPAGQEPWAILNINNISDQPVILRDSAYRVYVDGEKREARTTIVQRQFTDRLRADDVPLRSDENIPAPTVWPGESCVRKFQLTYLYDLSVPGSYTAYAEVMDPSSHRWLRTKMVTFEVTTPAQ